jgi:hypothetical protein
VEETHRVKTANRIYHQEETTRKIKFSEAQALANRLSVLHIMEQFSHTIEEKTLRKSLHK